MNITTNQFSICLTFTFFEIRTVSLSRIISFGLPDFKSVTVLVGRGQIVLCTCNVDFSWIRNLVCLHLLGGALLHSRRPDCWAQPILSGGSGDLAICGQSREGNRTDETDLHENLGGAAGREGEEEKLWRWWRASRRDKDRRVEEGFGLRFEVDANGR